MVERRPAEVFPPGDFIKEEMEARGWTQQDLAGILSKPLPSVNGILNGKKAILVDTARRLGAAFGTSAQFWMNLETSFRLYGSSESPEVAGVRLRAKLYELAPIREMEKRGWIKKTADYTELDEELKRFYEIDALDKLPDLSAAARASIKGEYAVLSPAQWAWCVRARRVANSVDARPFVQDSLDDLVSELQTLTQDREEIRHVPKILANAGIRFVVVKHLSKTRMDGAALWVGKKAPIIAVSLRFGRLDHFWFTLLHELAHIYYKDGVCADVSLFEAGSSDVIEDAEDRANKKAAGWLLDQEKLESFILRTSPLYSPQRIQNFSRRIGVHPSIVSGQLKFRKELDWSQMPRMNADVRDIVTHSAICDGWGQQRNE
ncbi:MAG: helix-turn-helix domain-containing protein [Planctomycetes bacterium]|nr:helix-turn-helix domain-containing protein [Planctomycetota bacterium]